MAFVDKIWFGHDTLWSSKRDLRCDARRFGDPNEACDVTALPPRSMAATGTWGVVGFESFFVIVVLTAFLR